MEFWLTKIKQHLGSRVEIILIGNKMDLVNSRKIQKIDGQRLAQKHKIPFLEASARECINVEECFQRLCDSILRNQSVMDMVNAQQN